MPLLIATYIPDPANRLGYHVQCLLPDACTVLGRPMSFASEAAMVEALVKLGADRDELVYDLERWGQGSIHVHPSAAQLTWLSR